MEEFEIMFMKPEIERYIRRGRVIRELGVDSISTPLVAIDGWREAAGDS